MYARVAVQGVFPCSSSQYHILQTALFGVILRQPTSPVNSFAQTAPRLWQPTQMSFRGAKRRGNPLNRNATIVAVATDLACSRNFYRAENLCYQFEHGQKLLPQFRKIVCLVFSVLCTQVDKLTLIQGVLINGMCNFEDGTRAATAARI